MTASTGCMLALTPSTKDRASSAGRFSPWTSPVLGNCLPIFALLSIELIFAPDPPRHSHISTMIAEGHSQRPQILGVSHTTYFQQLGPRSAQQRKAAAQILDCFRSYPTKGK